MAQFTFGRQETDGEEIKGKSCGIKGNPYGKKGNPYMELLSLAGRDCGMSAPETLSFSFSSLPAEEFKKKRD